MDENVTPSSAGRGGEVTKPMGASLRIVLGLAGFVLAAVSADAFLWVAFARPVPWLMTAASALLFLIAVGLFSLALGVRSPGASDPGKRQFIVALAFLLALVSPFAKLLWPGCYPLASEHARGAAEKSRVASLVRARLLDENDRFDEARDLWGGRYHLKELGEGALLVWSEGPDRENNHGKIQVAGRLFSFERAFEPCFRQPYAGWQQFLRRVALWEVTSIWGRLEGDIVWESRNGAIFLKH